MLNDQIVIRVDNAVRVEAERILNQMGIKTSNAIRMFLTQVCLTKSLPFDIKLPIK